MDYIVKPFSIPIVKARVSTQIQLKQQRDMLEKLSVIDHLTGIPNRRYGLERLAEEWRMWRRKEQPFTVIGVDVDHFKQVNDTYGHDVGDVVLTSVACTLRDSLRAVDILARVGGEEFLVLCPDTDAEGAAICAERLREAVKDTKIEAGGFDGNVTISVGLAEADSDLESSDELLKRADEAVYRAKALGRDQVCDWAELADLPESA